ncbi:sensor histidine kinase [Romboutsia weinsteinii]|uniref:histidine kinase n=1 Tax=Romboutsia weinsteinii TaxID=2020949 RepID=A0A371J9D4_9FIRM|nr:HAMP domain-containing sensor histidine kinase [Romboutsia weinsteinii]RDY29354.1 sensor histidine kinase [Romboutsia weinsteinii]
MTKLNKKLSISISIIVILVFIISFAINSQFVHRYYLHEKKNIINSIGRQIESIDASTLINEIKSIEEKYNVTIVYANNLKNENNNNEIITEDLLREFGLKGIIPKKFWISEETLENIKNKSVNRVFNQGNLKYSLLVKFILKDNYIFALAIPIEHSQETVNIINRFNMILGAFSVLIIVILIFIMSDRIIKPLEKIKILSKDIEKLNFRTEDIKTGDEIEELSNSINKMSISLEKAHNELNNRNENLKVFIGNASHDLKTPTALIKVYAMGIQDGIDDGTYIDTIIEQSDRMTEIIDKLLYFAKYEKKEINLIEFDLRDKLLECINKYEIIINDESINLDLDIKEKEFIICADEDSIEIVLDNLITNAIKYNTDKKISVVLSKTNDKIRLSVSNSINKINEDEIDKIWNPFYVLEKSRSKELSGTGLGLSIVKEILEAHNLEYKACVNDNKIEFYIIF